MIKEDHYLAYAPRRCLRTWNQSCDWPHCIPTKPSSIRNSLNSSCDLPKLSPINSNLIDMTFSLEQHRTPALPSSHPRGYPTIHLSKSLFIVSHFGNITYRWLANRFTIFWSLTGRRILTAIFLMSTVLLSLAAEFLGKKTKQSFYCLFFEGYVELFFLFFLIVVCWFVE